MYFLARNAETPYCSFSEDSKLQGLPMAMRDWEVGRSEGHAVMVWIRVSMSPGTKVSPRPTGLSPQESKQKRLEKGEGKAR